MCIRWIRSPISRIAPVAALFFALTMFGQSIAWAQYFAPPYLAFTGSLESTDGCLGAIDGGGYYRGYISAQLRQADGSAIYAGRFDAVRSWSPLSEPNSLSRNSMVRVRPDGTPDPNWNLDIRCDASTKLTSISALATDSAGNVYVGGLFTVPGTGQRQNLARFSADGKLDTAWQVNANGEIFALAVDENDSLFVGGRFTQIGGKTRPYLAKITQGNVVSEWNPVSNVPVRALLFDATGHVYVGGGNYGLFDGSGVSLTSAAMLVRLPREGAEPIVPDWKADIPHAPASSASGALVAALALDHQGRLYAGGLFDSVNGNPRNNIVRFSMLEGTVDDTWMAKENEGFPGSHIGWDVTRPDPVAVQAIAVSEANEVFVGGRFARPTSSGISSNALAKITAQGEFDPVWGNSHYGSSGSTVQTLSVERGLLHVGGYLARWSQDEHLLLGAMPVSTMNFNQQGLSGSWGRSNTPGTRQGFLFNFYPDNVAPGHGTVFAGWYTYDVAGGGQRWYALQGDVYSDNTSASLAIYTATDGNLAAGPNPTNSQVGTATLDFNDCSNGMLGYTFNDGRSGYIPLSRVTRSTTCGTHGSNGTDPANSLLAGTWVVPDVAGMGFVIDISPADKVLLGSWYTFFPADYAAPSPRQQWFVFQDSNFGPSATSSNDIDLLQSNGGTFDATVGGGVTTETVGKVSLSFQSCTSATFTYTIWPNKLNSQSVSQKTVNLVRLGPAPAGCAL